MPEGLAPLDDVLDRVLAEIRKRIEDARSNGQRVKIDARDYGRATMSFRDFRKKSVLEVLAEVEPNGGFELHIYIEPKR